MTLLTTAAPLPASIHPFRKLLVANRGEIAVRVIRACREMGISPVAIYSMADREALHVRLADEAYEVGAPQARDSYLRVEAVVEAARRSGAEAVHPGYGFLAENPEFAEACEAAGIVFIGPPARAMRAMGNKVEARRIMSEAAVPVVSGTGILPEGEHEAARLAREVGYPVILKAAAGGGGKGMRIVRSPEELPGLLRLARSEASSSFGDPSIYIERYAERARHIEVQVLADSRGSAIHLGERECSIQRRHQKLVEESPSPVVGEDTRQRIGELAVRAALAAGYVGAGTVEMLRGEDGSFSFMEMNTRLQVEHPVTEMVTGIDIVRSQIDIAAGRPIPCGQEEVFLRGHAIECRIYAEDPFRGFLPSPGLIGTLRAPAGPFVRDDGGVYPGYEVPVHYDPMISKLVAWGRDRQEAIDRLRRALDEYRIQGIRTTIPFLRRLVRHPAFLSADIDTSFIERHGEELLTVRDHPPELHEIALIACAVASQRRAGEQSTVGAREPRTGTRGTVVRALSGRLNWKLAGRLEGLRGRLSSRIILGAESESR